MRLIGMFRLRMSTLMMFVLMAAAASALFVEVRGHTGPGIAGWQVDGPTLFVLAIGLTGLALGAWKEHTATQTMLQVTLACLGCLTLIWIGEAGFNRGLRYWFQAAFGLTVPLPLLARRYVKATLPRGPRQAWWKRTCEAVFFSFLNIMLVTAGSLFQLTIVEIGPQVLAL
jgi:hypothetical protein